MKKRQFSIIIYLNENFGEKKLKTVISYLKKYKIYAICSPVFKLLEVAFELAVPQVVALIIDKGINDGDSSFVVKMGFLLAVFGIVGLSCTLVAQYFAAKASVGAVTELRYALFKKINSLSFSKIDSFGAASLITRMTGDTTQVQTGLNLALRLMLRSPFVVFGAMIMALTIDAHSALIFALTIFILFIVVFAIMVVGTKQYTVVRQKLDKVLLMIRDNLSGTRVIRAFGNENAETENFSAASADLTAYQKFSGRISALLNPLTFVIINLAVLVLIKNGAVRINKGSLTQGQVVALYNYMAQILVELIKLANLVINLTKSYACSKRIEAVLTEESESDEENIIADSENQSEKAASSAVGKVEFENVSFRYNSQGYALKNITFTANPGETVGIIGGTGSGKTTIANLIVKFYRPTDGRIFVDGVDINRQPAQTIRKKVGYVLQKPSLIAGTIRDNMKIGNETTDDGEIIAALQTAQALDFVNGKPQKLDSRVDAGGKNFSGGQRQRLSIAAALAKKPEILILDDSSSALDFATDARLRHAIAEYSKNMTTFIISQRTSSIRHADKIIVLDDGKAADIGTHAELLQRCEIYREIEESQSKKEDNDENE